MGEMDQHAAPGVLPLAAEARGSFLDQATGSIVGVDGLHLIEPRGTRQQQQDATEFLALLLAQLDKADAPPSVACPACGPSPTRFQAVGGHGLHLLELSLAGRPDTTTAQLAEILPRDKPIAVASNGACGACGAALLTREPPAVLALHLNRVETKAAPATGERRVATSVAFPVRRGGLAGSTP